MQEGSDCSSDLEQRDLSLDSIVTTNGAIQERRPGPAFPPPSPLIPSAVSAGSHSPPANRNQQPPPSVTAGRAAQPAVNFILGHLHNRRLPAVLVPSGGGGVGGRLMQTGREKSMAAPLLMTDPRRRVDAGRNGGGCPPSPRPRGR